MTSGNARTKPSVLVLSGIGLIAGVALRAISALQAHCQVFAAPLDGPVPTAANAVALLDKAGIDRAHLVGLSFGGLIAQEVATAHPERVRSLVLGATSAGGELYVPPERPIRDFVSRLSDLPAEEGLWATVPYAYAAATCRHRAPLIGQDIAQRLGAALDPSLYRRQHAIAHAHDTVDRLTGISAPTLVIHGVQDRLTPQENGRRLAAAIPGARFVALRGGAHAFLTDVPGATEEIVSFVLEHSRPRASRAGQRRPGMRTSRATPA